MSGNGGYLDGLLHELWPEADIRHQSGRSGRRPRPDRSAPTLEFVVLPRVSRPRLLLPRRPLRATAGALRNYKASATGVARLRTELLALAARLGAADLLPDRITLATTATHGRGVNDYLERVLARDVLVSPYIGPPRAVQKPILQLLDAHGQTFGFAKLGVTPLTRELVRAEAASLRWLAAAPLSHLRPPAVLHHGQWGAQEVLVVEAVRPARQRRIDPAQLTRATVELSGVDGTWAHVLADSPYWGRLLCRLDTLPHSALVRGLIQAAERLEPAARETELGFGAWHGDWAPWNMAPAGGRLTVWDWEQFESGVPLGFDAVHYRVQEAVVVRGHAPTAAFEAVAATSGALLAPFGVSSASARLVVTLYAMEIASRYLHDGEVEIDATSMARLHDWLLPTLDRLLDGLAPAPAHG